MEPSDNVRLRTRTKRWAAFALVPILSMIATVAPTIETRAGAIVPSVLPSSHFIWTATSSNTVGVLTTIDNGATNGQPNALLFVTPCYNRGGILSGVDTNPYDVPIGVYYDNSTSKWTIFTEDNATPIPIGESFNVLVVPQKTASAITVTAKPGNTSGDAMYFSNPLTDNNPNAKLIVTQNYNPGGAVSGVYNVGDVGVWYNSNIGKWAVYEETGFLTSMTAGAHFNVLIGSASSGGGTMVAQKVTASNNSLFADSTFVNNAVSNWDPNVIAFATHVYVSGTSPIYDDHALGVLSYAGALAVYNFDETALQLHTRFFVLIYPS